MKRFYNIINALCFLYFFIMCFCDIKHIINAKDSIESSVPLLYKNILYIILMMVPLILMLICKIIVKKVCHKKGIEISPGIISSLYFKIMAHKKITIPITGFVILSFCVVLFILIQNKFIYYPSCDEFSHYNLISNNNSKYEEISIPSSSLELHGWGYKNSPESSTIIYFGGNMQSSDNFFFHLHESSNWGMFANYNFLMIDYPGYGYSSGTPNYNNIIKVADSIYQFVKESSYYGNQKIIIMGFSLGTGVATYVASSHDIDGLILIAPYNNGQALYNSVCNIFYGPLKLLVRNPFPSDQFAKKVETNVLIIASEDDEVIPFRLSQKLSNSFNHANFITMAKLHHNDLIYNTDVEDEIKQFLNSY